MTIIGPGQSVPATAPHDSAAPPASEQGYAYSGIPGWGYFGGMSSGQMEDVPALMWPNNVHVYHKMRTDAQIDALLKSVFFPIRRLNWMIAPNGASDEVVEHVSQQLGLPIVGNADDFIVKGRRKFRHDTHLRMALLALVYGHMMFEQTGEVEAGSLMWWMTDLSPRMPDSIKQMKVARNGDLASITQFDPTKIGGTEIPITQLVPYCWELEGGNWAGRSMLRTLYKYWVLKDRMLRVDAIKNERFGAGIPKGQAPAGGDPADYSRMAQGIRASENGGVGLPQGGDLYVEGIRGTLPDVLGSIRMYDEQMARSFLAMFMQLGQTETGSRALSESFLDFFSDSLWAVANWYIDYTDTYVINDIVDWNFGEDEQPPLLIAEEREDRPMGPAELAELVRSGALLVDAEVQEWIRKKYNMPDYTGDDPLPTKPASPIQDPQAQTAEAQAGGKPSKGTPADKRLKSNKAKVTRAHQAGPDHDQASHGNRNDEPKADEPTSKKAKITRVFAGAPTARIRVSNTVTVLASAQTVDKEKIGHREPTAVELAAGTDFDKLQQAWQDSTAALVDDWESVRDQQIDAVVADVTTAVEAQNVVDLANLSAPILGSDVLLKHMKDLATAAMKDAVAEAGSQGVTLKTVKISELTASLSARADAVAALLARAMGQSAANTALVNYGDSSDAETVADAVRSKLEGLSDSYLNDQLGGALTAAQNSGRRSIMQQSNNVILYSSELLDQNTCEACAEVDGHEYGSLADADADYPAGGYSECLGGPRCRGTIVAVYGEGDNQ